MINDSFENDLFLTGDKEDHFLGRNLFFDQSIFEKNRFPWESESTQP